MASLDELIKFENSEFHMDIAFPEQINLFDFNVRVDSFEVYLTYEQLYCQLVIASKQDIKFIIRLQTICLI